MDVRESKKILVKSLVVESSCPPLVSDEKNNEAVRWSRTREISSRYRSPTPVAPPEPRRCPSPNVKRTGTPSRQMVHKRAISAERKRPSTPPSPPRPFTPVQDTLSDMPLASRKIMSNKMPESLWPSTMRSLNISFQSDAFPLPVLRKEKPVPNSRSDRALKPSSNISHKSAEMPIVARKATPERKRSPSKGKNAPDQSENFKPVDILHSKLVEQHRWPSRTGGKLLSSALTRSMDLTDKSTKTLSLRRTSVPDGMSKPLQKSSSGLANSASLKEGENLEFGLSKPASSHFLGKRNIVSPGARSQSLLKTPGGSRASSPSKAPVSLSSVSRGASPSRIWATNSTSRGVSPAHSRPSSPSRQLNNSTTSVLSFITDIKKGKKAASHIEDAHELRLLYNRHLQWRYANARANAVLYSQKVKAKKMLYNVWETTSELWDYVIEKRNDLQRLRLRLKLHMVLGEQMAYLEGWSSCESEHTSSLSHAVEDLRSSILRLPVTGGARGDIETVKAAVCSAVDVMQAMGSSISSVLSRMETMNCLVSELADVAAQERATTGGCEALLASIAALQVEEYSLRTHLIQMKEN